MEERIHEYRIENIEKIKHEEYENKYIIHLVKIFHIQIIFPVSKKIFLM